MVVLSDTEYSLQIFLVNLFEPALGVVLPVLPTHDLYPGHHVLEQLPVDLLGQIDVLSLALLVYVETVDEELDGAALNEDGEHDDGKGGGEEHLGGGDVVLVDHGDQGEANSAPQSPVRHDELLLQTDRVNVFPQKIHDKGETVDGDEPDDGDDEESPADEARVPDVFLEKCHPQVEEDDAVADAAEHLDEVVDGGERLRGDVLKSVVSLDNAAAYQTDDAGPVEELGGDVGHVGSAQQGQGLDHSHSSCESRDEGGEKSVDQANCQSTEGDGKERPEAEKNFLGRHCGSSGLHPSKNTHHVVEDHGHSVIEDGLTKHQEIQIRVNSNFRKY